MKWRRRLLEGFEAYAPGEQPSSRDVIKLNTNENPYPPVDGILKALANVDGESLRRYPDPLCTALVSKLAQAYGFDPAGVVVGNGSDEILAMAARAFLDPGDRVILTDPTYLLYENIVLLNQGTPVSYALTKDFELPPEIFASQGKLLFLASPNSPNGASFPVDDVARLSNSFPGVIVVDEAYADFAQTNCLALARERDNVLVVRTFSKSFSLASLRIGFALGSPDTIASLRLVKESYNVGLAAQVAACAALDSLEEVRQRNQTVCAERERVREALAGMGFRVYPSDANFLLFRCWDARGIYEALKAQGILVRHIKKKGLENCLRVSIGTPEQNDRFLAAVRPGG